MPRSHRLCLDAGGSGTLISVNSGRGASRCTGALPAAGPGPAGPAGALAHHRPAAGGARGEVSGGWRGGTGGSPQLPGPGPAAPSPPDGWAAPAPLPSPGPLPVPALTPGTAVPRPGPIPGPLTPGTAPRRGPSPPSPSHRALARGALARRAALYGSLSITPSRSVTALSAAANQKARLRPCPEAAQWEQGGAGPDPRCPRGGPPMGCESAAAARGRALKGDVTGRCVTPSLRGAAACDVREGEEGARAGGRGGSPVRNPRGGRGARGLWGGWRPGLCGGPWEGLRPVGRPEAGPPHGARGRHRPRGQRGTGDPSFLLPFILLVISFAAGCPGAPSEELRWWRLFTHAFPPLV